MAAYDVKKIDDHEFSIYHAAYERENIMMSYDWAERLRHFSPNGGGYFIIKNETAIGGLAMNGKQFTAPFLIPPFCDKTEFWTVSLNLLCCSGSTYSFELIPDSHAKVLAELGAIKKCGQRRMLRPTSICHVQLSDEFYFTRPVENDRDEIVRTVYEAHLHGYTASVTGAPDIHEIEEAVSRRFIAFYETDTLHFGTILKKQYTNRIAAVCLAGIYPDSPNDFSTIHQVAVLPEYRRQGLAKAMMLNSIHTAHDRSPVITLGVMIGNPAELLYRDIGFIAGCEYYDLLFDQEET